MNESFGDLNFRLRYLDTLFLILFVPLGLSDIVNQKVPIGLVLSRQNEEDSQDFFIKCILKSIHPSRLTGSEILHC